MKTKESNKLNEILDQLIEIDFEYIDTVLTSYANFYTIEDKTSPEDAFDNAVKLTQQALKNKKDIYQWTTHSGPFFSAYFVRNKVEFKKLIKMLQAILDKAESENTEIEKVEEQIKVLNNKLVKLKK
jgi:helix-turn-helix protein